MNLLNLYYRLLEWFYFLSLHYLSPKDRDIVSKLLIYLTEIPVFILSFLFFGLRLCHLTISVDSKDVTIVFIGIKEEFYRFLEKNIGESYSICKKEYQIYNWQILNVIRQFKNKAGLLFIKIPNQLTKFCNSRNFNIIPSRVYHSLNSDFTTYFFTASKELKREINRVKRYNYSYKITNSPEDLKFFYEKMYLPYIKRRYRKFASIRSFDFLKRGLKRGHLMLINDGNEYLSGSLNIIFKQDRTIDTCVLGIKDGDIGHLKKGAISALYYFIINWARDNNFKSINIGYTSPFIGDTLFNYKNKWSTCISFNNLQSYNIGMKIYNRNNAISALLLDNAFMVLRDDILKKAVF